MKMREAKENSKNIQRTKAKIAIEDINIPENEYTDI